MNNFLRNLICPELNYIPGPRHYNLWDVAIKFHPAALIGGMSLFLLIGLFPNSISDDERVLMFVGSWAVWMQIVIIFIVTKWQMDVPRVQKKIDEIKILKSIGIKSEY